MFTAPLNSRATVTRSTMVAVNRRASPAGAADAATTAMSTPPPKPGTPQERARASRAETSFMEASHGGIRHRLPVVPRPRTSLTSLRRSGPSWREARQPTVYAVLDRPSAAAGPFRRPASRSPRRHGRGWFEGSERRTRGPYSGSGRVRRRIGNSIGISPGGVPRRIRATWPADRRKRSGMSGP